LKPSSKIDLNKTMIDKIAAQLLIQKTSNMAINQNSHSLRLELAGHFVLLGGKMYGSNSKGF